jgi:hypothetical protein
MRRSSESPSSPQMPDTSEYVRTRQWIRESGNTSRVMKNESCEYSISFVIIRIIGLIMQADADADADADAENRHGRCRTIQKQNMLPFY